MNKRKDDTESTATEDRFYVFVTKDFPDFRVDMSEQMTGFRTAMTGVNGRLKRIEKKVGINGNRTSLDGIKTGFFKFIPWLITAVIGGAALGGYILAGGGI